MKESYSARLANHTGPESCEVPRKSGVEALTGGNAGQENGTAKTRKLREADVVGNGRKATTEPTVNARWIGIPRGRRTWARMDTSQTGTGRSRICPEAAHRDASGSLRRSR